MDALLAILVLFGDESMQFRWFGCSCREIVGFQQEIAGGAEGILVWLISMG